MIDKYEKPNEFAIKVLNAELRKQQRLLADAVELCEADHFDKLGKLRDAYLDTVRSIANNERKVTPELNAWLENVSKQERTVIRNIKNQSKNWDKRVRIESRVESLNNTIYQLSR